MTSFVVPDIFRISTLGMFLVASSILCLGSSCPKLLARCFSRLSPAPQYFPCPPASLGSSRSPAYLILPPLRPVPQSFPRFIPRLNPSPASSRASILPASLVYSPHSSCPLPSLAHVLTHSIIHTSPRSAAPY